MPFFLNLKNKIFRLFALERSWLFFLSTIIIVVAQTRYLAHSEYWSIFYSKYLFMSGNFQDSLYSKLIYHASLFWIYWLPLGNISHLFVARLIAAFLGILILLYCYKIMRLKFSFPFSITIVCLLYFNNISFWELPQLKADLYCLAFLLVAFYSFLGGKRRTAWLFILISFMCTPKSLIFFPLLLIYHFGVTNLNFISNLKLNFKRKLWFVRALFFVPLFFYGTKWIIENWPTSALGTSYQMSYRYGKELLIAGINSGFNKAYNFYPLHFLKFIFPTMLIISLIFLKRKYFKISKRRTFALVFLLVYSAIAVILYPLKHPYFLIPFFYLLVILALNLVHFQGERISKFSKLILVFLLGFHFISNFYQIYNWTWMNQGFSQYKLYFKLNDIYKINPSALIADGTGVLPRANNLPQFFGIYDSEGNQFAESEIVKAKPDVIFTTIKIEMAGSHLKDLIRNSYVSFAPDILTKKISVENGLMIDVKPLLDKAKETFNFPIHVISFRVVTEDLKNVVISASCSDTFQEKREWLISEIEKCSQIFFKTTPEMSDGKKLEIALVPWPSYEAEWPQTLIKQLNYKNN